MERRVALRGVKLQEGPFLDILVRKVAAVEATAVARQVVLSLAGRQPVPPV